MERTQKQWTAFFLTERKLAERNTPTQDTAGPNFANRTPGGKRKIATAKPVGRPEKKQTMDGVMMRKSQQPQQKLAAGKTVQMFGRLRQRAAFWKTFVTCPLVLTWIVAGYNLDWNQRGPPEVHLSQNHGSCKEHASFVDDSIADLLAAGSIELRKDRPHVVSPLGVVVNGDKKRLIFDGRYVNAYLEPKEVKYEDLGMIEQIAKRGDYMISLDLSKGYHHVDIHRNSQQFLGIQWRGEFYVFRSLPFGLSTAPWVFTKLMQEVFSKWRSLGHRCTFYLDDSLH